MLHSSSTTRHSRDSVTRDFQTTMIQDTVLTSSPKKRYRRTRSASPMLVDTPIETTIHIVQHALNKRQLQVNHI